jgi:anti-sigma B factor antagonist
MADNARPGPRARRAVVTLPDEIDLANADQVGRELDAALAPGVATVVADMTATRFCDTSGVRMLVLAHQRAAASGAELRVVIPSASVLRVLAITKVDTVLRIYPSLEDALSPPGRSRRPWRVRWRRPSRLEKAL